VTTRARVVAQAKVNLRLRVLARETTGYHSIETVFLRIDLGDDVRLRVTAGARSIDCSGPAMPTAGLGAPERNLAYRAAAAYAAETGWPAGFAIEIEKRIPVGGGLGGGSADAGGVLRALDALAPNPLGSRLIELATTLGADVPFMTIDSPMALAWGRGERLCPLPALVARPIVLAVPPVAVATADAYAWLAAARGSYEPHAEVVAPDALATWEGVAVVAANDFEPVVAGRIHAIAVTLDALRQTDPDIAMLSGSGSTCFAVYADAPSATEIGAGVDAQIIVSRTSERVVRVEANR
jgi:4-diphosphocytidyl-2-C-methyl-D-erythritol kinase